MAFETRTEGGSEVVVIDDARLDAATAERFKGYLFEQIEQGPSHIVIDLSEVRFMDSSGLSVLVAGLKKLGDSGQMALAAPQPAVKDLFDLTSMNQLFTIKDSVAEAVKGS